MTLRTTSFRRCSRARRRSTTCSRRSRPPRSKRCRRLAPLARSSARRRRAGGSGRRDEATMAVSAAERAGRRGAGARSAVREALVGYGFVLAPDGVLRPLLHLSDRLRDLHQPLQLGHPREASNSVGWENYTRPLSTTSSSGARSRTRSMYTVVVVPLADGARPSRSPSSSTRRSAAGRSSARRFYFPALASSAAITAIAIYILASDGLSTAIVGWTTAVVRRPEHGSAGRSSG